MDRPTDLTEALLKYLNWVSESPATQSSLHATIAVPRYFLCYLDKAHPQSRRGP